MFGAKNRQRHPTVSFICSYSVLFESPTQIECCWSLLSRLGVNSFLFGRVTHLGMYGWKGLDGLGLLSYIFRWGVVVFG